MESGREANRLVIGTRGSASPQVSVAPLLHPRVQRKAPSLATETVVVWQSSPVMGTNAATKQDAWVTRPNGRHCAAKLSRCHGEKWLNGVGFGQIPSVAASG